MTTTKIVACLFLCAAVVTATYVPYCSPPNGKGTKQYAIGSKITYSCLEGSVLIGERQATCLLDSTSHQGGYWSSPVPTCKVIVCPKLPTIHYGTVSVGNRQVGSTAIYNCDDGFILVGDSTRHCLSTGVWSGQPPVCKPRVVLCPKLYAPDYGRVSVTGQGVGSGASYKCDYGFQLVGASYRKCLPSGEWSGEAPICRPILCPNLPSPKYGSVTLTGLQVESIAIYECDSGFVLVGASTRDCLSSGDWSGEAPFCERETVLCPKLIAPSYGSVSVTGLEVGSMATYECNAGFQLVGTSTRYCFPNGEWSAEAPTCRVNRCPKLFAPSYGSVSVTGLEVGSAAKYQCDAGFTLVGSSTRYCLPSGEWSLEAPVCNSIFCPKLSPPNYGSVHLSGLQIGATGTYQCNDGFRLVGVSTRHCLSSGYWSGVAPTCIPVLCLKLLPPFYGDVSITGQQAGSTATYECNDGFLLEGETTRHCLPSGKWTGTAPTCRPIKCPLLTPIVNGRITGTGLRVGSTATHKCFEGFTLVGVTIRTCLNTGEWSGEEPSCKPVSCPDLPAPKYGSVHQTGTTLDHLAFYNCDHGFQLVGERVRTCLTTGQWSGQPPVCKEQGCGRPPKPNYGYVSFESTSYGAVATYYCDAGYTLNKKGTQHRVCLGNGHWSGQTPACISLHY